MEQVQYNLLFCWFIGLSMDSGQGEASDKSSECHVGFRGERVG